MRYQEEILHYECGQILKQVAQRDCGCPVPGSVQGQGEWDLENLIKWKASLPMARGVQNRCTLKIPTN